MYVSDSFRTSDRSIRWIENLAEQELLLLESKGSYDLCSTREEILASETLGFLNELRFQLEYLVRLFNAKVGDRGVGPRSEGGQTIEVTKTSSPQEEIRLSRNGVVLEVASRKPGAVHLVCRRGESALSSGTVEADFSSFHELHWKFLGEVVTSEKAACHFLTEFLQVSRSPHVF